MIDNHETELAALTRLHDDILRERAAAFKDGAALKKDTVLEREEALARLRLQVALLKKSLHEAKTAPRPAPVTPVVRPAPAPVVRAAPAPAPARAIPAAPVRPAPAKEASRISATVGASPARAGLSTLAPYLAIVACAAFVELSGARKIAAPAGPNLAELARPAQAVVANGRAAAKGAPVLAEEDRSQEALLLVHEWKLPGDEQSLGDRLGAGMDLPGGRPAWTVDRTGESSYRVTWQAGEGAPFAFEADLSSRVVWPTAETQELLAPRVAALRDAAR